MLGKLLCRSNVHDAQLLAASPYQEKSQRLRASTGRVREAIQWGSIPLQLSRTADCPTGEERVIDGGYGNVGRTFRQALAGTSGSCPASRLRQRRNQVRVRRAVKYQCMDRPLLVLFTEPLACLQACRQKPLRAPAHLTLSF
jgi:hypothetical protein